MVDKGPERYFLIRRAVWPLLIAWIIWSLCAGYAYWSSSPDQVFPVFAPIAPDGKPARFDLEHLPSDRYKILIGVEYKDGDHSDDKYSFAGELKSSNAVQPIRLDLTVIDQDKNVILRYAGPTEDWFVGTRTAYDASFDFDDMVFLFQSLELDANLRSEYTLEISLTTENADVLGKQLFVLVSGNRDDGYYPVQSIVLLLLSFVLLCVFTLCLALPGAAQKRTIA